MSRQLLHISGARAIPLQVQANLRDCKSSGASGSNDSKNSIDTKHSLIALSSSPSAPTVPGSPQAATATASLCGTLLGSPALQSLRIARHPVQHSQSACPQDAAQVAPRPGAPSREWKAPQRSSTGWRTSRCATPGPSWTPPTSRLHRSLRSTTRRTRLQSHSSRTQKTTKNPKLAPTSRPHHPRNQ